MANVCRSGVYFARDADYSCRSIYAPADPQTGHRYVYYAKVLVGEYTEGNSRMIVAPKKDTADPNNYERFDSVVDDVDNPRVYVLFNDYDFYTIYLITLK